MSEVTFIRAWPRDPVTGVEVETRLAGGGMRRAFERDGAHYRAGIVNLPRFAASLAFGPTGWTGGTVPTVSAIGFAPSTRAGLGELARLVWNDARIELDIGPEDGVLARKLTGKVAAAAINDGQFSFTIADLSAAMDKPILGAAFAGTGGIEGYTGATGRTKRRSWGDVRNVEGQLFDAVNNLYEFGDPAYPMQAFAALRDKGRDGPMAVLAWQGSIAATMTALAAATPEQGGGVVAPSIAMAKWWTTPSGPLTADLLGEIGAGYVDSVAAIASRLSVLAGGPVISNLAEAIAWRPAAAGIHIDDGSETWSAAIDRLLLGSSLLWVVTPAGQIAVRQWAFTEAEETLQAIFITRETTLPPTKERTVKYRRNNRVHSASEISAALLDGEAPVLTNRDPEPPTAMPVGGVWIDGSLRQFRFEGAGGGTIGGAPVLIGGFPVSLPGWVDILPEAVSQAEYQVDIIPPLNQTVFTDFLGVALPSQFPRVLTPTVRVGVEDIRTALHVSYAIETVGSVSASVNTIIGSADKGRITVTSAGTGSILLTVTVEDRAYGPFKIQFTTAAASAASTGGPGAKSAIDTTFPDVDSNALAVIAGPMTVGVATGQSIICAMPASYSVSGPDSVVSRLIGQWEYSAAGAGSWNPAPAGLINGTNSRWFADDYSGEPGEAAFNDTITGLTAGDYDVRFSAKLSSAGTGEEIAIFATTATVLVQ